MPWGQEWFDLKTWRPEIYEHHVRMNMNCRAKQMSKIKKDRPSQEVVMRFRLHGQGEVSIDPALAVVSRTFPQLWALMIWQEDALGIWESLLVTHKKSWETQEEVPFVQGMRRRQWKKKKKKKTNREIETISSQSMANGHYQSLSEEWFTISQEQRDGNHILPPFFLNQGSGKS